MTGTIGWIRCAGGHALVERFREEELFYLVRVCAAGGGFTRGQELRVPKASVETRPPAGLPA